MYVAIFVCSFGAAPDKAEESPANDIDTVDNNVTSQQSAVSKPTQTADQIALFCIYIRDDNNVPQTR